MESFSRRSSSPASRSGLRELGALHGADALTSRDPFDEDVRATPALLHAGCVRRPARRRRADHAAAAAASSTPASRKEVVLIGNLDTIEVWDRGALARGRAATQRGGAGAGAPAIQGGPCRIGAGDTSS